MLDFTPLFTPCSHTNRERLNCWLTLKCCLVSCVLTFILLTSFSNGSWAAYSVGDLYQISREPAIVLALQLISQTSHASVVDKLINNQVHILFQDLSLLGHPNDDAMSIVNRMNGQQYTYIAQKHISAPPEALAALIVHESMHDDDQNSIAEEVAAWTEEARTWEEMTINFPELSKIQPGTYPLVDRLNALVLTLHQATEPATTQAPTDPDAPRVLNNTLETLIRSNPTYQGLPEHSPSY